MKTVCQGKTPTARFRGALVRQRERDTAAEKILDTDGYKGLTCHSWGHWEFNRSPQDTVLFSPRGLLQVTEFHFILKIF